jgi:hypothetical protein
MRAVIKGRQCDVCCDAARLRVVRSAADGLPYEANRSYRLRVPANAPVKEYWSVTAYDRQLHTVIKGIPRASRSSQLPDLQKNADGSVDIDIGPKPLEGGRPTGSRPIRRGAST